MGGWLKGLLGNTPNFVDIETDDPAVKRENWLPSASEFATFLKDLKAKGRKIKRIRFTGHGTSGLMQFGQYGEFLQVVKKSMAFDANRRVVTFSAADSLRVILEDSDWIKSNNKEIDVTDLLKELMDTDGTIELRGCNTADNGEKGLAAQLSKALPDVDVYGNTMKTLGMNAFLGGINAALPATSHWLNGVEVD